MQQVLILLSVVTAAAMVPVMPGSSLNQRLLLCKELCALLGPAGPSTPPRLMHGEILEAVEALEALEFCPETADFHSIGIRGDWDLRALTEPPHPDAIAAFETRVAGVDLRAVTQSISSDGKVLSAVDFELEEDGIRGRLEVEAMMSLTPAADILDLRTGGRKLSMPRMPKSMEVPEMLKALHGRLSTDFRADDGVRLGMQTTYLDETLRITRCTTGRLHGECAVHLRRPPEGDEA